MDVHTFQTLSADADGRASGTNVVKSKPQSKRQYTSRLRLLETQINQAKAQLQSIVAAKEKCLARLEDLRVRREETAAANKNKQFQLQTLNKEVESKRDEVASVERTLPYKNEDKLESTIKCLEHQLQVNNFKLKEERKIVKELDALKRTRKDLKKYELKKAELSDLRAQQQLLRSDRDALNKVIRQISSQIGDVEKELSKLKAEEEKLQKVLEDLSSQKDAVSKELERFLEKLHLTNQKKKEEEKSLLFAKQKECEGVIEHDVYIKQRQLCTNLITYLQSFYHENEAIAGSLNSLESSCSFQITPGFLTPSPASLPIESSSYTVLKKKESESNTLHVLTPKDRKQCAKSRRRQQKRPITHTPETLEQFSILELKAPCKVFEVPVSIEQLKAKRKYYEKLALARPKMGDLSEQTLPLYSLSSGPNPDDIADTFTSLNICINNVAEDKENVQLQSKCSSFHTPAGEKECVRNSVDVPENTTCRNELVNNNCVDVPMDNSQVCTKPTVENTAAKRPVELFSERDTSQNLSLVIHNSTFSIPESPLASCKQIQCSLEDKNTYLPTVGL